MKKAAIFIFALFWSGLAGAALPDGVAPAQWDSLLQRTIETGENSDNGFGTYRTLKRLEPAERTATHQADYFSVVGAESAEGKFSASHVETVFEYWEKLADSTWRIDQWIFPVSLSGNLRRSYHAVILEEGGGTVIDHQLTPLTEEEAAAAWAPRLRGWL